MKRNCIKTVIALTVLCLLLFSACDKPAKPVTTPTGTTAPQQTTAAPTEPKPTETEPDPAVASLEALRQSMEGSGQAFAVAYFGYHNTPDTDAPEDPYGILREYAALLCEEYPFMPEIPAERVVGECGDLFCIVPLDPNAAVTVSRANWDDENGQYIYDDAVYSSESGEPILLFCEARDVLPDTQLCITTEAEDVIWNPFINDKLCVEPLQVEEGKNLLWDFTDYWQLLAVPYYNMVDDGWEFPTAESLEGTTWRVPWDGYWVTFHERTCDVGWLDENWEAGGTYTGADWELTYDEGFAVLEMDFDRFAGVLKYNLLYSREQDILYFQLDVSTSGPEIGWEPLYRYLNPAVMPDPAEMAGTWELAWTEAEGYRVEAEPGRSVIEIVPDDGGEYRVSYRDKEYPDWNYENQEANLLWVALYEGCGNDFWQVEVNYLGYNDTEYAVALLEDGTLLLQTCWEMDGAPMVGYACYRKAG